MKQSDYSDDVTVEAYTTEYHDTLFSRETFHFTVRLIVRVASLQCWVDLTVPDHLPPNVTKESVRDPILLLGLPKLHALLEEQGPGVLAQGVLRLQVDPDEVLDLVSKPARKRCLFQQKEHRGLVCTVGTAVKFALTPANATTYPVCQACGHPDDRIRCSQLMHVSTDVWPLREGWKRMASGMCGLGYEVHVQGTPVPTALERCRLGERECARLEWEFGRSPETYPIGVGQLLLRELDHLNLAIRDLFDVKPVTLQDAGLIGRLVGDVSSIDEFTLGVAALAALIDQMKWPSQPKESGSINALEQFAADKGKQLDRRAIGVLRALMRLRQGPPIHGAASAAAAGAVALGISYPPTDPAEAWRTVRGRVADSLARIRDDLRR